MRSQRPDAPWCVLLLLSAFAGCAGPSIKVMQTANKMLAAGDFAGAASYLEQAKERQYGKHNAVLYHLDVATVLHHAGRYKESDEHFDMAERRMDELYTKSVSQAAGTLLLNDSTQEYAGEVFERALTNVFRALNRIFMGQPGEALVEARKVERLLDEINAARGRKGVYKDDAFARYLDSLLYADAGQSDDARISYEAANGAYGWYAAKYQTPVPDFGLPPLGRDGSGEVVFIHFNGVAPRKISKTFQVAWGRGLAAVGASKADSEDAATQQKVQNALRAGVTGNSIVVSYPAYVQDPFTVVASELRCGAAAAKTLLMEDISAIAAGDLKDRLALIETRAIARATVKFILARQAEMEAKKQGGDLAGLVVGAVGSALAAGTEAADTRGWGTLPAQIRMARLRLPPGRHDLAASFIDAAGAVAGSHVFQGVEVRKGKRTYIAYRTAR
ncbi:MAG: hypothetical protein NTY77_02770 [Elusimicrobia bacterium]|nr:hypothetical protein [Elusimicrobiota bacterium]